MIILSYTFQSFFIYRTLNKNVLGNNNFTFLPKLQRPPPSKLVHKLSTQRSFSTFHPENDVSDDEESKCRVQNPSLLASSSSIATNLSSSRSREFDNVQRTPIFETEYLLYYMRNLVNPISIWSTKYYNMYL